MLCSELNKDLWKITWEFYLNSVVYHGDLGCAHGDHMSKAGGLILKTGPLHGICGLFFRISVPFCVILPINSKIVLKIKLFFVFDLV